MEWIELLKALILGIVEGLTEFAPVSSTGHMIVVDEMWLKTEQFLGKYPANTFKVVIQLGSILAVVIVFWKRLWSLLGLYKDEHTIVGPSNKRMSLKHVLIGLLPAVILGLCFEDFVDEYLFSIETVLIGLVVGAILMLVADRYALKEPSAKTLDDITYKQALLIGLFQCFSLWPGFSRAGSTISAGVLLGLNYKTAADFTFIMAVPIMIGASSLSLYKNWDYISPEFFSFYAVGFVSAFLVAYISIKFFLKLIEKIKLKPFAYYRIGLAAIVAFLYYG